MTVPTWLWLATIGGLSAIILIDLLVVGRNPHAVTIREATRWVLVYVAMAVVFGLGLWYFAGGVAAGEFFAGYITEYSLSVDNLFVFVIIMAAFRVPAAHQHRVLLVGIVIALVLRGLFIAVGAAAIHAFSWMFYLFAIVLIVTAVKVAARRSAVTTRSSRRAPRCGCCAGCCRSPRTSTGRDRSSRSTAGGW